MTLYSWLLGVQPPPHRTFGTFDSPRHRMCCHTQTPFVGLSAAVWGLTWRSQCLGIKHRSNVMTLYSWPLDIQPPAHTAFSTFGSPRHRMCCHTQTPFVGLSAAVWGLTWRSQCLGIEHRSNHLALYSCPLDIQPSPHTMLTACGSLGQRTLCHTQAAFPELHFQGEFAFERWYSPHQQPHLQRCTIHCRCGAFLFSACTVVSLCPTHNLWGSTISHA